MPGRPRDPEVDRRIARAALDLFADAGWAGFAMEAVARRAGVGKASLYLRWSTKEALLTDAVTWRLAGVADVDTGTLRGDLVELATQMLDIYAGDASRVALRLGLEAAAIPGVAEHYAQLRRTQVLAARAIVRRGIDRGEVAPDVSVTLLLDTLIGGAMMHALVTPDDRRADLARNTRPYAGQLVSFLLRAVARPGRLCPGRIPDDPGHLSRDSGTKKPHRMYVDLDLPVAARPARPLTPAVLAWTAAALTTVLAVFTAALALLGRDVSVLLVPGPLTYAWVGCVLLARRPGHPMGPLLCLIGLADIFALVPYTYMRYTLVHAPGSLPFSTAALWMNTWSYAPATSLGGMVLLLVFPEGRLLSRRFRPALWAALAFIPLSVGGYAFVPQNLGPLFRHLSNPYALPQFNALSETCQGLSIACGLVAGAAGVTSVWLRWRRADRVGRQQIKWFLAVLPATIASLIATLVFPGTLSLVLALPAGILMPIAIGIAVTRHRLFEIDILLNRAALYGLLTAGVAGVYLAVVVVAHSLFGVQGRGLAVQIIATVLAAAALWPLHDRVQRRVDQLFYGDRGVPYEALARLGRRVEEAADPETALNSVVKTIADSLRLPYAALELRLGDGWSPAATYGEAPSQVVAFPLTFQRETVGRLLVGMRSRGEQLGPDDVRLLADLARQAGPAAHVVALRRALDASRAGLVTAREEERRRLRRDLHDGIGPTLAGLTLGLDTARARAADQPGLVELLGKLKAETQRAVTDVRRIVYGLRPPALDDFGLIGSLREEVGRLQYEAPALTVTLDAPDSELPDLPAAAEVACYRIVTEALTNITRHALATKCTVRIRLDDQDLDVEVRDDGVGLPEGWRAGVGITSMRERVAELGGGIVIEPALPHGTRINARMPARERE